MELSGHYIKSEELFKDPISLTIESEVCHKRQQLQGRTSLTALEKLLGIADADFLGDNRIDQ